MRDFSGAFSAVGVEWKAGKMCGAASDFGRGGGRFRDRMGTDGQIRAAAAHSVRYMAESENVIGAEEAHDDGTHSHELGNHRCGTGR